MSLKNDKKSSCTIFSSDFRGSNFRENLTDSEREKKVKKAEEAVIMKTEIWINRKMFKYKIRHEL